MQKYIFQPQYLFVNEETNFSDVWESFCLKLLKLEYKTNNIERRKPPESGIDLYYKEKQIAFQCKSIIEGSRLNITKYCNSLISALPLKKTLPWSSYIFCLNDNITENQLSKLKSVDQSVDVKGKDYWIELCRRFPEYVKTNFRTVCEVPENRIHNDMQLLINGELSAIKEKLAKKPVKVLIYHQAHDQLYDFTLSKTLTVQDLLLIARRLFMLHETIKDYKGLIQVKPFFLINNVRYDENQSEDVTLEQLGIEDYDAISFSLEIIFVQSKLRRTVMYANKNSTSAHLHENEIIKTIFYRFESSL